MQCLLLSHQHVNQAQPLLSHCVCCPAEAQSSRLLRTFPKDLLQSLAQENITANFHFWSLSKQVCFSPLAQVSAALLTQCKTLVSLLLNPTELQQKHQTEALLQGSVHKHRWQNGIHLHNGRYDC